MAIHKEMRKISQSFSYAARGISLCVRYERNFRIHICAAVYVTIFGLMAKFQAIQFAILLLCFALMLSSELFNTAIERLCDKQSNGYNSLVRDAKDIAAAAVFVCAMFCVVIGGIFFLQKNAIFNIMTYLTENPIVLLGILGFIPFAVMFIFGFWRKK